MEDERLQRVMSTYEEAVAMDIRGMADTAGFSVRSVKVTIETDRDSPLYGHVTDLYMKLGRQKEENAAGGGWNAAGVSGGGTDSGPAEIQIEPRQIQVEPVQIGSGAAGGPAGGGLGDPAAALGDPAAAAPGDPAAAVPEASPPLTEEEAVVAAVEQSQILARTFPANLEERTKINAFIRKVAGYYGLETAHVQVEWEDD